MSEKNRRITAKSMGRACRAENVEICFDHLTHQVRGLCPDPNIPTYIADVPAFVQYFCEQERPNATGRRFLSSCTTFDDTQQRKKNTSQVNHINDVGVKLINAADGYSINPEGLPTLVALLSDWLALALAKNLSRVGHSTFSETAAFPFYT